MTQDKQLQEKCIEFSSITPERLGVPKNLLVNSVNGSSYAIYVVGSIYLRWGYRKTT